MTFEDSALPREDSTSGVDMRQATGFTLVELMVASSIMIVALVGVYSVFQQALEVEERTAIRWKQRAAAGAVVDHLAEVTERCVNLSADEPAIEGGRQSDGSYTLTCTVASWLGASSGTEPTSLQRRRYRWGFEAHDRTGSLELKALEYSGSSNLTPLPGAPDLAGLDEEQVWSLTNPVVIGTGLSALSVEYRRADDPEATWADHWDEPAGQVAVRIRATVGERMVERVVVPMVNGAVLSGSEGQ